LKYFGFALAATLLTEPSLTLWVMQMSLGHQAPGSALGLAFGNATLLGFFLFGAFRIAPFGLFALFAFLLDRARVRLRQDIGFLCAVLACAATMIWGNWAVFTPLFAHTHMSSTSAIAFLFIPFYAGVIGAVFALLATGTRWVVQRFAA
jgi:hypothetical protein